jgi:elongation factor G
VFGLRLEPHSNADMPALEVGLQRLLREDPSLQVVIDAESNSVTLRGMGELHLEVALHRLCKDFGCKVLSFYFRSNPYYFCACEWVIFP